MKRSEAIDKKDNFENESKVVVVVAVVVVAFSSCVKI